MNYLKNKLVFLFMALAILVCGCAVSHSDVTFSKTTAFWSGEPIIALNVPYPEPLQFEFPSADWVPIKIRKGDGVMTRVEAAEGGADSYVKVAIEGQTKELFESLETESGVDFSAPDSVILTNLMDHYKTLTQSDNADKPIQYSETKFDRFNGDACAWMLTSNGNYGVAYAVFLTRNSNYFTVEINQKNRSTDMEKTLLDIIKSHKAF